MPIATSVMSGECGRALKCFLSLVIILYFNQSQCYVKAVLFDMDGTFLDSLGLYKEAEGALCARYGVVPDETDWHRFVWLPRIEAFGLLAQRYNISGASPQALVDEYHSIYESIAHDKLRLHDDFEELARWLKDRCKLAVVTSSERRAQGFAFKKFGLEGLFDAVVTGCMVEKRKPHPEPYQRCLEILGVGPLEAVVVEDSPGGILSAKSTGILTLAVGHTFPKEELLGSAHYALNLKETKEWFERFFNVQSFES